MCVDGMESSTKNHNETVKLRVPCSLPELCRGAAWACAESASPGQCGAHPAVRIYAFFTIVFEFLLPLLTQLAADAYQLFDADHQRARTAVEAM